ncbi:MAG TPA: acyltransferase family protein [bacterium]|nr:acyltransferase family protein [bacterium]HPS28704.1 acyltransferase family protein [bacterium]
MPEIFHVFQYNKMVVENPYISNLTVWLVFFLLTMITLKKETGRTVQILERAQTVQLRGFAALFVMTSHFWTHASKTAPFIISKGETVYIFLFFSGFGMVISHIKKDYTLKKSIFHRIKKVMMPYWISTLLLIPLGILIKNESYSLMDIIMTISGINTTIKLNHIDYVRWYITFLIIWYFVFYIAWYPLRNKKILRYLLYAFSIIFLFTVYRPYTFCHQFTAFPLGCIAADNIDSIRVFYNRHRRSLLFLGMILLLTALVYKTAGLTTVYRYNIFSEVELLIIQEFFNILFLFGAIVISGTVSTNGFKSGFLNFCGLVSFPFFLLHGAFLIKFNPVIYHFKDISISGGILVFTAFMLTLSYGMKKIIDKLPDI